MKRKKLSCALALLLFATSLSGCGTESATTDPDNTSTPIQTSDSESDGTIALTVWGSADDQSLLAEMVDGFKTAYANEASFDITIAPESESTCKDMLLGDPENGADVFAFADDQLTALAAAGVLEPIEDADSIRSANLEGSVNACSIDGALYAYPMTADNGYFMYYNKHYFSDSDLQTLDGMLAIAAQNQKKITIDYSSGWYVYSFFGLTGLTVGLNDNGLTNYCTWNDTEGEITGVDVAQAMMDIGADPGFLNANDDGFLAGVEDGSVIAGVSGVWNSTPLKAAWGDDYGACKLPTYTCNGEQIQMASFAGYKMVGANAYSEHYDWALKLAEWITREENQTLRFEQRGQGPSNIKAAESEAVSQSPAIQALLAQSEYASLQRIGGNYWDPVTAFASMMASGDTGGESLQSVLDSTVKKITSQIQY